LAVRRFNMESRRRYERHLTGKENGPTLDFARRLAALKRPVWTRFVVVPGLTDNELDIAQIAAFTGAS
jgi:pyruvate formate lyase activating enzyme